MLKLICVSVIIIVALLSFEGVGDTKEQPSKGIFLYQDRLLVEDAVKPGEVVKLKLVTNNNQPPIIKLKIDDSQDKTIILSSESIKNKTYIYEYNLGEFNAGSKIMVDAISETNTFTSMYQQQFSVKGTSSKKDWWNFRVAQVRLESTDEIRTIGMIRILCPPRDITVDIPGKFYNYPLVRFDLNVGVSVNKGNETSEIKESKTYLVGFSYELHKYVDLVAGASLANKDSGDALTQGFWGISLDFDLFSEILKLISGR